MSGEPGAAETRKRERAPEGASMGQEPAPADKRQRQAGGAGGNYGAGPTSSAPQPSGAGGGGDGAGTSSAPSSRGNAPTSRFSGRRFSSKPAQATPSSLGSAAAVRAAAAKAEKISASQQEALKRRKERLEEWKRKKQAAGTRAAPEPAPPSAGSAHKPVGFAFKVSRPPAAARGGLANRFPAAEPSTSQQTSGSMPKRVVRGMLSSLKRRRRVETMPDQATATAPVPQVTEPAHDDDMDPLDSFMQSLGADAVATSEEARRKEAEPEGRTAPQAASPRAISLDEVHALQQRSPSPVAGRGASHTGPEPEPPQAPPQGTITRVPVLDSDDDRIPEAEAEEEEEVEASREALRRQNGASARRTGRGVERSRRGEAASENGEREEGGDDEPSLGVFFQQDDMAERFEGMVQRSALVDLEEKMKKKGIKTVDHSKIDYLPFRRKFYIQSREITRMSEEEVQSVLERNEIKVRGKKCPRPILEWHHCGLSDKTMHVIRRQGYERPFAVQMQALPAIMNGRDVIGVAKTGSGKTLAFLLPMFRHIADQPPLAEGEGPVALVMAPARELAVQIFNETRKFARVLGLRVAAIYGGASVAEQIADLKRGAEIIVCTPGRMIDLMTMNAGRLISLHRVTYVVLDEADRMFDMGFGPQIEEVVKNIRPDRQTVMFSATFPSHVEHMARTMLRKPLEIIVGRRSAVSSEVEQIVEMREEREKWRRLLQILGVWHDRGNALIFVDTQERCDEVFSDLMKAGYFALSLHGGMDQVDRDQTIADFKNKLRTIMVATSVAGRGLDVRDLVLVVNFNCPNHLEDYVHRVGRTGRAGNKGTAYTFITPEEAHYAPDLVRALKQSKTEVPDSLKDLAATHREKVKAGKAKKRISGYGGHGYTFDAKEKSEAQKAQAIERTAHAVDEGAVDEAELEKEQATAQLEKEEAQRKKEESRKRLLERVGAAAEAARAAAANGGERPVKTEEEEEEEEEAAERQEGMGTGAGQSQAVATLGAGSGKGGASLVELDESGRPKTAKEVQKRLKAVMARAGLMPGAEPLPQVGKAGDSKEVLAAKNRALLAARALQKQLGMPAGDASGASGSSTAPAPPGSGNGGEAGMRDNPTEVVAPGGGKRWEVDFVINDYPQKARSKIMQRSTLGRLMEGFSVSVTSKGQYVSRGTDSTATPLHLIINGVTRTEVVRARNHLLTFMEEATADVGYDKQMAGLQGRQLAGATFGRYSVFDAK